MISVFLILMLLYPIVAIDQPVLSTDDGVTGKACPGTVLYMRVYQSPILDLETTTDASGHFRFEVDLSDAQAVLVTNGAGLSDSAIVEKRYMVFMPIAAINFRRLRWR